MEIRKLIPYAAVLIAVSAGAWALAFATDVRYTGESGIRSDLPVRVGEWTGESIFYCQSAGCERMVKASEATPEHRCPACGGELSSASRMEWSLLPADTTIRKAIYTRPDDARKLIASIVLGGESRTSIHRPQICLVGNGQEITGTKVLDIQTAGDARRIRVTLLDLLWRGRGPDGAPAQQKTFYAYWFIGKNRETHSHLVRMFWMAWDRIVRGVSDRWAYVGVAGHRETSDRDTEERARAFIRELEPQLRAP